MRRGLLAIALCFALSGCFVAHKIIHSGADIVAPFRGNSFRVTVEENPPKTFDVNFSDGVYTYQKGKNPEHLSFLKFRDNLYIIAHLEGSLLSYHLAKIEGRKVYVEAIGMELAGWYSKYKREQGSSTNPFSGLDQTSRNAGMAILEKYSQDLDPEEEVFPVVRSMNQMKEFAEAWLMLGGKFDDAPYVVQ